MQANRIFYQKTQTGNVRVLEIELDGELINTTYYYYGSDAKQQASDRPGEKFQKGHASYKSAEEQAAIVYHRKCKALEREGNKNSYEEAEKSCPLTDFEFSPLSPSFSPPKPINKKPCLDEYSPEGMNLPNKKIKTIIDSGRLICQKKYNGLRHFMVKANGKFDLYTMRIKPANNNYPWLVEWFQKFVGDYMPDDSMIDMELVANDGTCMMDFEVIKAMKPNTKPETAAEILQKHLTREAGNTVGAIVHDILFWAGSRTLESPYNERLEAAEALCKHGTGRHMVSSTGTAKRLQFVTVKTPWGCTDLSKGIAEAESGKWEGLVLKDREGISKYAMNSRHPRPQGSWKWKTFVTDDFLVTGSKEGTGRNQGKSSAIALSQYTEDGELIYCGECGSGFTHEQIDSGYLDDLVGKVVEVKFAARYDSKTTKNGTYGLQFPTFVQVREDKEPKDCIYFAEDDE